MDQMMIIHYDDLTPQQREQTKRFNFLGFPPGEAERRDWYVGEDSRIVAPKRRSASGHRQKVQRAGDLPAVPAVGRGR